MSIRFETTVDDLVAFNRYHYENSPTWQKQRNLQSMVVALGTMLVPVLFWFVAADVPRIDWSNPGYLPVALFLVVGVGMGLFFFVRWRALENLEASVRKLFSEGSNRAILGWCEMALAGRRVVVKREWMDVSYDLRAVQKIVTTDAYAFVYVSSVNAMVIPLRLFPEDEYRDFVAELLEAWENRDLPGPEEAPDDRIRLAKMS